MTLINTKLASNPMNWLTVILMLIFAGMAGQLLLSWMHVEPATADAA